MRDTVKVWLTRDSSHGKLDNVVIHNSRPERKRDTVGAIWLSDDYSFNMITVEECQKTYGTAPEDDLQCVRVERWKDLVAIEKQAREIPF